jgi:heme/copper-type cytochrome/quinol oxidase subunit 3
LVDRSFRGGMIAFILPEVHLFAASSYECWRDGGAGRHLHWPANIRLRPGVLNLNLTFGRGIYGSLFYLLTGLHGLHVLLGEIMLAVVWWRALRGHFSRTQHFAFEASAWYWHFVDVVRLLLLTIVYWI